MKHSHALVLTAETADDLNNSAVATGFSPIGTSSEDSAKALAGLSKKMAKFIADRTKTTGKYDLLDEFFAMLDEGIIGPSEVLMFAASGARDFIQKGKMLNELEELKSAGPSGLTDMLRRLASEQSFGNGGPSPPLPIAFPYGKATLS